MCRQTNVFLLCTAYLYMYCTLYTATEIPGGLAELNM